MNDQSSRRGIAPVAANTSRRVLLRAAGATGLGAALLLTRQPAVSAHGADEVAQQAVEAINAAMATGDEAQLDELFAADLVGHPPHRSLATGEAFSPDLAGLKAALAEMRRYFPDGQIVVEDLIVADDKVAGRLTFRGTPDAAAFGLAEAPSGPVEVDGVAFAVIADDRVKEFWAYFDMAEVMSLMMPATPAA